MGKWKENDEIAEPMSVRKSKRTRVPLFMEKKLDLGALRTYDSLEGQKRAEIRELKGIADEGPQKWGNGKKMKRQWSRCFTLLRK